MAELTLVTYDWVPELPRGFVRDLRIRWALEEAGLPYRVETTPFHDRQPGHFAHQPFGQTPWLTDGDISIFESGAILLHLGELSETLMAADPKRRSDTKEWLFAALSSVEIVSQTWWLFKMWDGAEGQVWDRFEGFLNKRLGHMETVLASGAWLAGEFSIADILMADVLRLIDKYGGLGDFPACQAYVARATNRPAFQKAYADQMAHFAAAD